MEVKKVIASEYVSFGHPDKIADRISDSILDAFMEQDKNTRAGIEVMVKDNIVVLGGEITSNGKVNYEDIVRQVFEEIKFPNSHNLAPDNIKIINLIGKQSVEINKGVDQSETVIGAGDQGFVVGYASNETKTFMPLGIELARQLCNIVSTMDGCGPDTKSQVIVEYNGNQKPIIKSILISTMHSDLSVEDLRLKLYLGITLNRLGIDDNLYTNYIKDKNIKIDINPCGEWRIGGPVSDCGVTGRKIVVDQYGGYCNVGGGALSGKDMSKIDRSAAYMSRYIAKNIVASGIANKAKVELSYMIGKPSPSSINIELDTNNQYVDLIKKWINENIDLTPYGIIKKFGNVKHVKPLEKELCNRHYGICSEEIEDEKINKYFPWEKLDFYKKLYHYIQNNK